MEKTTNLKNLINYIETELTINYLTSNDFDNRIKVIEREIEIIIKEKYPKLTIIDNDISLYKEHLVNDGFSFGYRIKLSKQLIEQITTIYPEAFI